MATLARRQKVQLMWDSQASWLEYMAMIWDAIKGGKHPNENTEDAQQTKGGDRPKTRKRAKVWLIVAALTQDAQVAHVQAHVSSHVQC